ncbi:MAG: hypothetical protein KME42_21940 [Tildeniella nuda ZEHNDER 1965/U140]|jgi:hypothetical protein|nr:hypothetical protein [Tildeniella nuda ZEHNDER 1965/U140]
MLVESTGQPVIDSINASLKLLPKEQQTEVLEFVQTLVEKTASTEPKKTIWEKIDDIMANVPDEAWENMPTDGSYQHDHYLYGTPKREL